MGVSGMNPDELERTAQLLANTAQQLDTAARQLSATLTSAQWHGPSADAFRSDWNRRYRGILTEAAKHLRDGHDRLRANANQQRHVSATDDGARSSTAQPHTSHTAAPSQSPGTLAFTIAALLSALRSRGFVQSLQDANFLWEIRDYLQLSKVLQQSTAIHSSLFGAPSGIGLLVAGPGALNWIRATGLRVPHVDIALTTLDVAVNWKQHGLYDAETTKAVGLGTGQVLASGVAGPLGALAWTAGTTTGQFITDHTQIDEHIAGSWWNTAYGDRDLTVPERSADWYRSATPDQIAADNARAAAAVATAQDMSERAQKPWLFAWDVTQHSAIGKAFTGLKHSLSD